MNKTIWPVRVDIDGMAVTGRSVNALRGLRFDEGEETADNTTPSDPIENTPDPVQDAQADILAAAQSRIAELEGQLAEAQATLVRVQAHNYTLLTGTPAGETDSTPVNSQNSDDPEEIIDPVDVFFDDDK